MINNLPLELDEFTKVTRRTNQLKDYVHQIYIVGFYMPNFMGLL